MTKRIRDGLSEWHLQYVRALLIKLLKHRSETGSKLSQRGPELAAFLSQELDTPISKIVSVLNILSVTRTTSGISFHRTRNGLPTELAVNFGQLEIYQEGAELTEYASFNGDEVIGGRWVQNEEEALLMILGHELAHHVVCCKWDRREVKPHGEEFKRVYRLIRLQAVNPLLDEFAMDELDRKRSRYDKRLITKLSALRKMATDKTSNENEAERAMRQLEGLLSKHELSSSSLDGYYVPHFIERTVPVISRDNYKPILHILWDLSNFCDVEAVIHTQSLRSLTYRSRSHFKHETQFITFLGAPADAEMAVYLSEVIHQTLFDETQRYRDSSEYQNARAEGYHPRTLIFSFRRAFLSRLASRLRDSKETIENSWCNDIAKEKELMVQKKSELKNLFEKRYPNLRSSRDLSSSSGTVASASERGLSAANRVNLNRPLETARNLAMGHG